jgi:hypothetical protein
VGLQLALRAAKLACEALPNTPAVWQRRVALEAKLRGSGAAGAQGLLAVLREALRRVPSDMAADMWLTVGGNGNINCGGRPLLQRIWLASTRASANCALARCPAQAECLCRRLYCLLPAGACPAHTCSPLCPDLSVVVLTPLIQPYGCNPQVLDACKGPSDLHALSALLVQSRMGAARAPPTGGLGTAAGRVLATVWEACGAEAARQLFSELAALPPAGADMYRQMLQLEGQGLEAAEQQPQQHGGGGAKPALNRVRRVLEAAVDAYGDVDAGLWLAYAQFEQQHAKRGAGPVYWRAVKALRDADAFIQEFRASVSTDV